MKATHCLFFFLIFVIIYQPSFSQSNCDPPVAQIDLNVNNVRARLLTGGDLWWDGSEGQYIVPNVPLGDPQVFPIYAGSLWMGGLDEAGNLKLAAQTYGRNIGNFDFYSGPINTGPNPTDQSTCANWDKFFNVTAEEIAAYRADFWDNGMLDDPIPNSILGWPGKGNPFFFQVNGFELPDQNLAPFFDLNENGLYEPDGGDYPLVQGDQSVWWVFNDAGNLHTGSGVGDQMLQMEIQANAFAYGSDTAYIDNTTFYEFKLIYKGAETLAGVYVGLWVNVDLGCYTDDYIGCNPTEKLAYVYNGDDLDEDNCDSGTNGYGENTPFAAVKVLKSLSTPQGEEAPFASFIYYLNGGIANPQQAMTDPANPGEYYNYLRGRWRDGWPLSKGGNGYNPGADAYPYAFDGSEVDGQPWMECTANTPPSDRLMLISLGPVNLSTGDVREFAFAVLWKDNVGSICPPQLVIAEQGTLVENFYIRKSTELLVDAKEELPVSPGIHVAPNPMQESIQFFVDNHQSPIQDILIYSTRGQLLKANRNIKALSTTIHRDNWANGMYFYEVVLQNKQRYKGKLVVY